MSDPLAEENRRLRAQLDALLTQATQNQRIWQRQQDFDLQLIASPGLRELLDHLFVTLPSTASLDVVTLVLLDPQYEVRRMMAELSIAQSDFPQLLFVHEQDEFGSLAECAPSPLLARYSEEPHGVFFPEPLPAPASVALMPLCRQGRLIGSLNFGSNAATRFGAGMGSEFLAHTASIVAVCLENAVNNERLRHMGLTDALTGVHNRRYLERRLLEEMERVRRHGHPLSCLYLDIDHFKQINDRIGHHAGDQVLREVAGRIKAELRLSDTLGRFGGEEFVVLLADADVEDALGVAERIRQAVAEPSLQLDGGGRMAVSVSVGVAIASEVDAVHTQAVQNLLARADRALYMAKQGGRNRVVLDPGA